MRALNICWMNIKYWRILVNLSAVYRTHDGAVTRNCQKIPVWMLITRTSICVRVCVCVCLRVRAREWVRERERWSIMYFVVFNGRLDDWCERYEFRLPSLQIKLVVLVAMMVAIVGDDRQLQDDLFEAKKKTFVYTAFRVSDEMRIHTCFLLSGKLANVN